MTCRVKDCPIPELPHLPVCQALAGHRCWGPPTHQHKPKKGMGGNNPASKIVSILCTGIHDAIDNGLRLEGLAIWDVVDGVDYTIHAKDRAGRLTTVTVRVLGAPW